MKRETRERKWSVPLCPPRRESSNEDLENKFSVRWIERYEKRESGVRDQLENIECLTSSRF